MPHGLERNWESFLEIDDANTKGVHFCKFLRIRVEIKIRIRVEKEKIKYGSSSNMKSLSDFCYSCGRLGHAASICHVKEDSPFKGKFGLEMRATETSWSKLEFSNDHITHTHTHKKEEMQMEEKCIRMKTPREFWLYSSY
jgi:hypothetical protein